MAEIKKINTEFQLLDKFLDTSGDAGTSGQVLSSTASGVNWVSGSGLPGGPYLPLAGGTMSGTNGVLMPDNFKLNLGTGNDFQLYHDGTHGVLNNTTGNLYTSAQGSMMFRTSLNVTALTLDASQNATFAGDVTIPQYLKHANDADTYFGFSASNQVLFHVGGSDRLIINSAGNVGIGVTSPSTVGGTAKLTVNVGSGTSSPVSIVNGTTDGMYIRRYAGNGQYQIQTTSGSGNSGNLSLQSYGGNVGIGTTSPSRPLSVYRSTAGSAANFLHYTDATAFAGLYIDVDNVNNIVELNASGDTASTMAFQTGNAERMRITTTGNVGIGTTSPANKLDVVGISRFTHSSSTSYRGAIETVTDNAYPTWEIGWVHTRTTSSTYGTIARFNNQTGTSIGGIVYSGSSGTSFVTTSDYRLKENIKEIRDSISRVKKLKPCRFNFAAEKNRIIDGFIAHEVQEVVPEAVHGEKDALQKDGSIDAQTLEVSRLIPVLTKALQEAINKIEELELRIQTIENN